MDSTHQYFDQVISSSNFEENTVQALSLIIKEKWPINKAARKFGKTPSALGHSLKNYRKKIKRIDTKNIELRIKNWKSMSNQERDELITRFLNR